MHRRQLLLIAGAALAAGCSSTPTAEEASAKRREIDTAVDGALAELYKSPGVRELAGRAKGVLVFPKVTSAGFLIGGSYGQGALRKGNSTAGYYSVGSGSVGLLAGAETKSMYLLFMSDEALRKFEASDGWTAGADASVTVVDSAAASSVSTQTGDKPAGDKPVLGFVRNQSGLMANLSVDGSKFNKLKL
jgi:lipid-binding SYLF domain-containing protein